jgi:drug/metabolite transporter (DMT)-like permease
MLLPVALASVTALSFSISGILVKGVSSRRGYLLASFAVALGDLVVLSIAVLFAGLSGIGAYSVILSVLSGIMLIFGYTLFYKTLEKQQASNTYATIEIQVLLIGLYGIFALKESIGAASGIGMLAIVIGILLVSTAKGMKFNMKLAPAIAANAFWALSWILLVYPINNTRNPIIPTLLSFLTFFVIITAIMIAGRRRHSAIAPAPRTASPKWLVVGVAAGMSSGFGNTLFTILTSTKHLVTAAVIGNSSPAIVAVLAYLVYHDRLTKLQLIGLVIVVAGGIIMGVY